MKENGDYVKGLVDEVADYLDGNEPVRRSSIFKSAAAKERFIEESGKLFEAFFDEFLERPDGHDEVVDKIMAVVDEHLKKEQP